MNIAVELQKIKNGAQIVVGTPGKIVDLMVKQGKVKTHNLRFFVLDEADQLCGDKEGLDMIMKIFNKIPKKTADGARLQVSFLAQRCMARKFNLYRRDYVFNQHG